MFGISYKPDQRSSDCCRTGYASKLCFALRALIVAVLFVLVGQVNAYATVKLSIGSDAKTKAERKSEGNELGKALNELLKSKKFLKVFGILNGRCPTAVIRIVYGDSTKHTKASGSGGTFVPNWTNPKAAVGKRGFKGGTLIVDKAMLKKLRPGHDYKKFLAEVITHELFHAYEDCLDTGFHSENIARNFGEQAAKELKYATLDETRPPPPKKPKEPVKTSQATSSGTSDGVLAAGVLPGTQNELLADLFLPSRSSAPPALAVTAEAFTGQLDRRATGILGYDNGVMISPNSLIQLDNDESVHGLAASATLNTTGLDNQLWGDWFTIDPATTFSTGLNLVHVESNAEQRIDRIPTGAGNNLLIFSPEGQSGGLAGGLNAGPRDAVNVLYSNNYRDHTYQLKKQVGFETSFGEVSPNVTFGYGETEIYERFSGQVAGINQDFAYNNMLDVDTFSIGVGVNVEIPIGNVGGTPVEFYGGASATANFNDHDGDSKLDLNGIINAQEMKSLSGSETTGAFEANVGFSFKINDKLDFVVGAQVKSYDVPGIEIAPQEEARVRYDNATEFIVRAAIKAGFGKGGPLVSSDRRLKREIVHLATLDNGIRLYRFKYLWSDQVHVGVMAQDLLADETFRQAVVMMPEGFYAVNYAMLGLTMTTLEEWEQAGRASVRLAPVSHSNASTFENAQNKG